VRVYRFGTENYLEAETRAASAQLNSISRIEPSYQRQPIWWIANLAAVAPIVPAMQCPRWLTLLRRHRRSCSFGPYIRVMSIEQPVDDRHNTYDAEAGQLAHYDE
jgi:hypothetical protein